MTTPADLGILARCRWLPPVLILLLAAIGNPLARGAQPLTLYVSPLGEDRWSGALADPNAARSDGPFATLARAREEIRKRKALDQLPAGAKVILRQGLYTLSETLQFDQKDAGTLNAPIIYQAFPRERPILVGGPAIPPNLWKPGKGGIVTADLSALGLKDPRFKMLIHNGKRMPLARYPNFVPDNPYGGGWAFADGKPVPMYEDLPGEDRRSLLIREADLREWRNPKLVEVFVFPRYNWWNNITPIESIDREKRSARLAADCSYPIRPGDRYYFRNALEELDAPGEWFFDSSSKMLHFLPEEPIDSAHPVTIPTIAPLVSIGKGASHISLIGLTLECSEGEAAVFREASDCLLAGCTIRNVGDYTRHAVSVSGGTNIRISGNDIHDTGASGISLQGGDRPTLTPANHVAENNYIHHVGLDYKHGVGVQLSGVGLTASRNLIHDGPRMGILFSGNNLLLELNHIRHVNLETEDTGAVYTGGRDWISSRGTIIRHNYFHDILGFGKDGQGKWVSPHFAWGVYLDDNTGGVDVIGNIVARCSRAGLHLHNGRDNLIVNNVFVDNGQNQHEYNGWTKGHSFWTSHFDTMVSGYESVAKEPAWQSMRNMKTHPKDAILPDGTIMSGNVVERNVFAYSSVDAGLVSVRNFSFQHNTIDNNVVWDGGKPIKTGQKIPGAPVTDNLAPNAGFEQGSPGAMPADWQWQIKTPKAIAELIEENGSKVLRLDAAFDTEKPRDNYPIVVSKEFNAKPGHSYEIQARLRSSQPGAKAGLMLQGYIANVFFWSNWPNELNVDTEWKEHKLTFTIPGPGERGYNEQMGQFRARVDFPDKEGSLYIDDVSVREIQMLGEWESWQAQGMDRHSLVADPMFVDPSKDDYRLRPESPAARLGFEPIPVEKIGPYSDALRASWPIREAPGAREYPVKVPQP